MSSDMYIIQVMMGGSNKDHKKESHNVSSDFWDTSTALIRHVSQMRVPSYWLLQTISARWESLHIIHLHSITMHYCYYINMLYYNIL